MRKPKAINYDTVITLRINKKNLEEFKEIVGEKYQKKIRELMEAYVKKTKEINELENKKRESYLKKEYYL